MRVKLPRMVLAFGLVALGAVVARPAHAQNADSFHYSNEAALTAGAMVAVPGDDGATFYNPAGLGSLHRTRLNANGSVFGVRVRPVRGGLVSSFAGQRSAIDFGGADFVTTPTTASASFSLLPHVTVSGGAYHTANDVRAASGIERVEGPDGRSLAHRLDTLDALRKMHVGGAYGIDLGRGLRIGSAMFLVYSARNAAVDYAVGVDEGGAGRREVVALGVTQGGAAWGLQPTYGFQWDVTRRLHVGVVFRFPELQLTSSVRTALREIGSGSGEPTLVLEEVRTRASRIRYADPARLFWGVAYDVSEKARVAFDADVAFPLEADTWGVAHRAMVRARAGVLLKPLDALHVGFGAFVDPSSARTLPETLGAIRVDYVGGTFGVVLRTRIGEGTSPDAPVVTLATAVRYAVGFGEARTVTLSDAGETPGTTDVRVHDVMPYVGSSIAF